MSTSNRGGMYRGTTSLHNYSLTFKYVLMENDHNKLLYRLCLHLQLKSQDSQTTAHNRFLHHTKKHVQYLQNGFINTRDQNRLSARICVKCRHCIVEKHTMMHCWWFFGGQEIQESLQVLWKKTQCYPTVVGWSNTLTIQRIQSLISHLLDAVCMC